MSSDRILYDDDDDDDDDIYLPQTSLRTQATGKAVASTS
jgi:hypothetical protein